MKSIFDCFSKKNGSDLQKKSFFVNHMQKKKKKESTP